MKKIAAITMVRNDDFYLRKWVEYYSRELGGKEHLYIYFDGLDQEIAPFCEGTHAEKVASAWMPMNSSSWIPSLASRSWSS